MMNSLDIGPGRAMESLASFALSVHNIACRMPVAIKEKGGRGLLVANGRVRDVSCECDALDSVFSGEPVRKVIAERGEYAGIPMYASAIMDIWGDAVAAIGVIDTSGMLSLNEFAEISSSLSRQAGKHDSPVK